MIYATQEELDAALAKWQRLLRLQDWTIRARVVTHHDGMISNETWNSDGQSAVMRPLKTAVVRLNSIECARSCAYPELHANIDQEQVLVHELLHLCFHDFEPPKKDALRHDLWEQTIEVLAQQFVALDRRTHGKEEAENEVRKAGQGPEGNGRVGPVLR